MTIFDEFIPLMITSKNGQTHFQNLSVNVEKSLR